jgi:hypothetical protein
MERAVAVQREADYPREADSTQVSRHYSEALAYAADFNPAQLEARLGYLAGLLQEIAKDGDVEGARTVCESIVTLWKTADLDEHWPQVVAFFVDLRASLLTVEPG